MSMIQLQQDFTLPWEEGKRRRSHRRRGQKYAHDYIQYIKYGAGVAAGITVVGWIKRKIQGIPVVGILATPFLCLMPTVLLGTAVGAAVVYGIDEGDPLAAQKKLVPKVQKSIKSAHREIQVAAGEVSRNLRHIHQQHIEAAEVAAKEGEVAVSRLARSLDRAAAEAETTLGPSLQRHADIAKQQLDRHVGAAAAEYERWLQQRQSNSSSGRGSRGVQWIESGSESE